VSNVDSFSGRSVLTVAHVAGMVDMVALPLWVGTLAQHYQLNHQQAGLLVTLFLLGAVIASALIAPRFQSLPRRGLAASGFALSAIGFLAASQTTDYTGLFACHLVAGLAAGTGLSITHGSMGRSRNPHRMFALAGIAIGVFAILFYGLTPKIIEQLGGKALFYVFGTLMAIAAVVSALAFPQADVDVDKQARTTGATLTRIPKAAWFVIVCVVCMALNQAMVFSFLERVGAAHGFAASSIVTLLIVVGFVNLMPAPLAAWLETKRSAYRVATFAPALQAALALVIMLSLDFLPYAIAGSAFVFVMIFTHTFLFGLIAKLDPTGRAAAATPATLMLGAALGPVLGGTLSNSFGFAAIGVASVLVAVIAILSIRAAFKESKSCVNKTLISPA
jgi:predicted MFS family arabinose efflux permease